VLFSLLNFTMKRVETTVDQLYKEAIALNTDILKRTLNERFEVLQRAYIAKEMTIDLEQELATQALFYNSLDCFERRTMYANSES
jgi:hypothetical protein